MKDRWALLALGAWWMGSVAMIMVATRNFRLIDELLQSSPNTQFQSFVQRWGAAPTRDLLRYLSSELNREYFQHWNFAQLALGAGSLWLLPRRSPEPGARRALVVAFALVIAMSVVLAPRIVAVGRSLDFVPHEPAPPALQQFWVLHVSYTVIELIKLVLLGLAAFWLARSAGTPRTQSRPGASLPETPAVAGLTPSQEST